YEQENEAEPLPGAKAVVLGSGPIRIGQGIEFDYCSVRAAQALRAAGVRSLMVNSNPETVSTDFDMSDRLYFESLDDESVLNILENEAGMGPATAFAGDWPAGGPAVETAPGGPAAAKPAEAGSEGMAGATSRAPTAAVSALGA